MPIDVRADLVRLTQREFAAIAYEVVSRRETTVETSAHGKPSEGEAL